VRLFEKCVFGADPTVRTAEEDEICSEDTFCDQGDVIDR